MTEIPEKILMIGFISGAGLMLACLILAGVLECVYGFPAFLAWLKS